MGPVSGADLPTFDAVILAGGSARRLGGVDKAELVVSGRRLIDRVLDAVCDASLVVVVGPERETQRPVSWVREEPAGAGPAAALEEGLRLVRSPKTLLLAVDLPLLDGDLVRELVVASGSHRAAVAIDEEGRLQPLLACYPTGLLRRALTQRPPAGAVMPLLESMPYVRVEDRGRGRDCDTPEDVDEMQIGR